MLGSRQPDIYGRLGFEAFLEELRGRYGSRNVDLLYAQSNHEGELIDCLHRAESQGVKGIVFNAGAYTHTSIALADAVAAISVPVVEVHISNVYAREPFRHRSYMAPYCRGSIAGLGLAGYELALIYLLDHLPKSHRTQP